MTGKVFNKDLVLLIIIGILTVLAVAYGFSLVPSPTEQRAINYDTTRANDLNTLKANILDYDIAHNVLPTSLDALPPNSDTYSPAKRIDPETNKPYEYKIINDYTYELCATFATDTINNKNTYNSSQRPTATDPDISIHLKGRQCSKTTLPDYLQTTPTPTYTCLGVCPSGTPYVPLKISGEPSISPVPTASMSAMPQ